MFVARCDGRVGVEDKIERIFKRSKQNLPLSLTSDNLEVGWAWWEMRLECDIALHKPGPRIGRNAIRISRTEQ